MVYKFVEEEYHLLLSAGPTTFPDATESDAINRPSEANVDATPVINCQTECPPNFMKGLSGREDDCLNITVQHAPTIDHDAEMDLMRPVT